MRSRSAANSADSSPPSPPLISMMTSRAVVRVARDEQTPQRSCVSRDLLLEAGDLLGERLVLLGRVRARPARSSDAAVHAAWAATIWLQLGVAPVHPLGAGRVRVHGRVGELAWTSSCSSMSPCTDSNMPESDTADAPVGVSGCCCRAVRVAVGAVVGAGIDFWICTRNSTLDWVSLSLAEHDLQRLLRVEAGERPAQLPGDLDLVGVQQHLLATGAGRVDVDRREDALVGELSAIRRSSVLPVPLNSSKMTSSILEPVSTSAVARMVSEPPFSMLRAAPKKRFGG